MKTRMKMSLAMRKELVPMVVVGGWLSQSPGEKELSSEQELRSRVPWLPTVHGTMPSSPFCCRLRGHQGPAPVVIRLLVVQQLDACGIGLCPQTCLLDAKLLLWGVFFETREMV
ncbi:hypothetical protein H920_06840 [Fukomys damarensis]|uniref:Uncharacterized protein n=1 Tax=Fukomys damarensis TaxID=885580 RepID=A0A091DI59_FUKDA|nr:hypothetical protein H920_06840 [Fukomys damarensis]